MAIQYWTFCKGQEGEIDLIQQMSENNYGAECYFVITLSELDVSSTKFDIVSLGVSFQEHI